MGHSRPVTGLIYLTGSAYFVLRLSVIMSKYISETILTVQLRIKFQTLRKTIHSLGHNTADEVAIKLQKTFTSMLPYITTFSKVHYHQSLRDVKVSEARLSSALQVRVTAML